MKGCLWALPFFAFLTLPNLGLGQELEGPLDPLESGSTAGGGAVRFYRQESEDPRLRTVDARWNQTQSQSPSAHTPSAHPSSAHSQYHHLLDHAPKVTSRYGGPFTNPLWRCDLRVNSCLLKNRVKYAPFRLRPNFAHAHQALVLDVGVAARSLHGLTNRHKPLYVHPAARLTSARYFPAQYSDACLTFAYYWDGAGRKTVKILQRNEETVCVYADEGGTADMSIQHEGRWKEVQVQLDLRYGPAQFVVEFTFDTGEVRGRDYERLGSIAIKDFSIGYGVCQRNEGNECDAAEVVNYVRDGGESARMARERLREGDGATRAAKYRVG